ncbi:MAG: hypothetical protein PHH49_06220 [Candidatus Omnitrophica bacterium]|nr:hypothetical protein [Candidatus Omnitrophota bacterium]MDD5488535.1 hypothetical protein [Candidatus Omnitrophota bacterium]
MGRYVCILISVFLLAAFSTEAQQQKPQYGKTYAEKIASGEQKIVDGGQIDTFYLLDMVNLSKDMRTQNADISSDITDLAALVKEGNDLMREQIALEKRQIELLENLQR